MADLYGSYEDFIPLAHGVWHFRPNGVITKGSPVKVTVDGANLGEIKVEECADNDNCIGIAMEAATAADDPRTIKVQTRFRAIVKLTASAAITRGRAIRASGADRVKEQTDQAVNEGGVATFTIPYASGFGIALQSAAAAADILAAGLF